MPPMAFKCAQCPDKTFSSRAALYQHYRQAPQHPFCVECTKWCHDGPGLEAHNAAVHPQFKCTVCKTAFLTQSSLDDHYRGKASIIHPNCNRCGKGFFNVKAMNDHFREAHPTTKCCGRVIFDDDLSQHYTESTYHPKCDICAIGFKGDEACSLHAAAEHPDLHCAACHRQFPTREAIDEHFQTSTTHPKCPQCGVGLLDDATLREHFAAEHAVVPRLQIAPPPTRDLLAIEDSAPGAPRLNPMPLPHPGDEVKTLWRSTANKIVPNPFEAFNTMVAVKDSTWKAPAEVYYKSSRSYIGGEMPSTRLLKLATEDLKGHDTVPRRQIALDDTPKMPQADRFESWKILSQQSSAKESAIRTTANSSSSSNNSAKTVSPQSSSSSLHSGSASFASDSGSGLGSFTANTTITAHGGATPPKIALPCMKCQRAASVEPTATLCGHVFCKSCVELAVMKTKACPKCAAATLLYCLLPLHLDD